MTAEENFGKLIQKHFKSLLELMFEEKIQLISEELAEGLVLRLKTEWTAEGVKPDDFEREMHTLKFENSNDGALRHKSLIYIPKDQPVVVADFYQACSWLLAELKRKEQESHYQGLIRFAEQSMKRLIRRGVVNSTLPRVYAFLTSQINDLPRIEYLNSDNVHEVRRILLEKEEKLKIGGTYRVSGVEFFKNLQWEEKGARIFAFDPCYVYETGSPKSMQFREDLERYAKLAR